jgi:hypothetical protein
MPEEPAQYTKYDVTEGRYLYTRPSWGDGVGATTGAVPVEVMRIGTGLVVRFQTGRHPSRLSQLPEDAIFIERD